MNTAEYLIKKLEELGITDIFGVPGDYNFNILYAINDNPNVRWIGCTNELNAGYAADGYARNRGYGAILTTYGVGELSVTNAIAGSMAENVPVIHIVGAPDSKKIENRTRIHHNLADVNPQAFCESYKSITQTTAFLTRDNSKLEIDRVLKAFVKEKKPVYISIPSDVALMEISDKEVDYNWMSNTETLKTVVLKICEKLKKAENPVILGDILIKRFDSTIEFLELVEKTNIPTTNFLMGTGLVNSNHKNYIGTYFGEFNNIQAKKLLETTDCLIAVGVVYSDLNAFGFNLPYKINSQIAIYGTYTYVDGIRYDNVKMADVLEGISNIIERKFPDVETSSVEYSPSNIEDNKLTYNYIYPRLQEFLKENDIIFAEIGMVPHGMAGIKYPDNIEYHSQLLWASIGWATPAAFGACISDFTKRIILITGEGAHQMTAMEIGNMLRYNLKPVIIVLNNKGYTIERLLCNNPDAEFNDIVQLNYSKFARSFEGEIWSTRVETAEDFDKALKVTQIMNKLCYIEVCVDSTDIPTLTKEYFNKAKQDNIDNSKKDNSTLKSYENFNLQSEKLFGTTVHESLKDEDA